MIGRLDHKCYLDQHKYGDEVDRPLQKSNKEWTYFANDIAYHFDKIDRGY